MGLGRESKLRAFAAKLCGFLRGRQPGAEFDDEIQEHLQMLAERFVAQGMTREEAAAAARRQFGNTTLLREDHRELQTFQGIEAVWQDLRYGWRGLLHAPGFLLTVTVTIALGLGVNTALFTLFDAYYLRPIPVRDPLSFAKMAYGLKPLAINNISKPRNDGCDLHAPACNNVTASWKSVA